MSKNYAELALKLHEEKAGKVSISSKVSVNDRDDLSIAYTPGVAAPCVKISENPDVKQMTIMNIITMKKKIIIIITK